MIVEVPNELVEFIEARPADLSELAFERGRDRRDHHVRARARIECRHFNRREIDCRQRGNWQQFVTEHA